MDKSVTQHLEVDRAAAFEAEPEGVSKAEALSQEYHENGTPVEVSRLSFEHRQYLLRVHGTLDLDPIPAMDDADPYNWPTWKVGRGTRPEGSTSTC